METCKEKEKYDTYQKKKRAKRECPSGEGTDGGLSRQRLLINYYN